MACVFFSSPVRHNGLALFVRVLAAGCHVQVASHACVHWLPTGHDLNNKGDRMKVSADRTHPCHSPGQSHSILRVVKLDTIGQVSLWQGRVMP